MWSDLGRRDQGSSKLCCSRANSPATRAATLVGQHLAVRSSPTLGSFFGGRVVGELAIHQRLTGCRSGAGLSNATAGVPRREEPSAIRTAAHT